MKAWIKVERGPYHFWVTLFISDRGHRFETEPEGFKTKRGALALANRWAEYLGGLEVKDLTGED